MPTPVGADARLVRFGTFELALDTGELRNKGVRIKIEGQPLRVLALLLEHHGELVTREQLKQSLWPDDTFVDFEHGINVAVKRLREALNDSATTPRFIETLPRRGYRFICPVDDASTESLAASSPARPSGRRRRPGAAVIVVAVAVVVLALYGLRIATRWFASPDVPRRVSRVAVLPLENLTGNSQLEYVGDSIQDDMITLLGQLQAIDVIARGSTTHYKNSQKSVPEIARELTADAVVEGAVHLKGTQYHITVRLIEPAANRLAYSQQYDRDRNTLSLFPREVVTDLVSALAIAPTVRERQILMARQPINADAYEAYQIAKHYASSWTNDGEATAIAYLERALALEPTFASAWERLGLAYEQLATGARGLQMSRDEALAQAEAALQRAIDLDPTLRHSHQALARIRRGKGDFEGAAREYRRAREVDPKWLGPEIYLLDTGRYDEAVAAARQAARNDPWNYAVQILPGNVCFWAGRYDESIEHLKKATDLDPDNPIGHYELAWNFVKKGMADKAVEECDRATALRQRKQPGAVITECGWVYAATGRRAKAVEIASRLPVAPDRRETTFTSMADARGFKALAKIHAWLGDRDRALVYLQQASDVGMPLANDAMFPDDLKADPRFRELARKQRGFPPATGALAENRTRAGRVAAAGTI